MKFTTVIIGMAVALVAFSLGSNLTRQGRIDLTKILRDNIPQLTQLKLGRNFQHEGRNRLYLNLFDENGSQYQFEVGHQEQGYKFDSSSEQEWTPTPLTSGFTLGKAMSRSDKTHIVIIGDRCDVVFMCLLKTSKGERDDDSGGVMVEEIAPRAFALMQYQANVELKISSDYEALDAARMVGEIKFESDQSRFSLSTPNGLYNCCLGSSDVIIDGKKYRMSKPILMNENGIVEFPGEFYDLQSHSKVDR